MYCYNLTFLVDRESERRAIDWISRMAEHVATTDHPEVRSARISIVRDVPGFDDYKSGPISITAQFGFSSLDTCRTWGEEHVNHLSAAFGKLFGAESMVMPSILEDIIINNS